MLQNKCLCYDIISKKIIGADYMRRGDNVYIVESNRIIRPAQILNCSGGLYLVKFLDSGGAIRVHPDRLYNTREAAEEQVKQHPIKAPDWH